MKVQHDQVGSSLKNKKAHRKHHAFWSRRSFIQSLGLTTGGSLLLGNQSVQALNMFTAVSEAESDRKLVIIRQKGGNDGLNMIVPTFDYGTYASKRPTIAIDQNDLWSLNDKFAMPNTMSAITPLWNDGKMKVINSVGYPDQNLSHFRSSDIWDSASDSNVEDSSGWLGRMLDQCFPDFAVSPPDYPPGIQIGNVGSILLNNADETRIGFSVANADLLFQVATKGELYDTTDVPDCHSGQQLSFVRNIANQTFVYSDIIKEAYEQADNEADYGRNNNPLGQSLSLVARLIKGGLGTQVYMVTIDGHDTHASQNQRHPGLMQDLSDAISGFFEDLATADKDNDVLCCTTSEFGRRIEQNASGGTDHGAAAPVLLFGDINGSDVLGKDPDLSNTDQVGNLIYGTDFRAIYATILENWLCLSPSTVDQLMGQNFGRMPELGIVCSPVTSSRDIHIEGFVHEARYHPAGGVFLHLELPKITDLNVQLFSMDGRSLLTVKDAKQVMGQEQIDLRNVSQGLPSGIYLYRIQAYGYNWSRQVRLL